MLTLRQHLAQLDTVELRIIAQNQGILLEDIAEDDLLTALVEQMLQPQQVQEVWNELPEEARLALAHLAGDLGGMPAPAFQRRFGELRRFGPGRLQTEQPWKSPTGPGEILWYRGWIANVFQQRPEGASRFICIPEDLAALLPLSEVAITTQPPLPAPLPSPQVQQHLDERLLDDLGTLLAYVQNHAVWLRSNGRWRLSDLQQLTPRLRLAALRKQPLEAGGPLHLIFYTAKKLNLIVERNRRHRFGKALRPWLEMSRDQQMQSLFRAWRDADDWNDLCLMPGLRCQDGAWSNDPLRTRQVLLEQLRRFAAGDWFGLEDFIAMMYEYLPDFQRPDGLYDTWYIQNAAGDFLRGFEHWPAVEGRLIRYIWHGPLFWLGVVALDEAGEAWSLTPQGRRLLDEATAEQDSDAPILSVGRDFNIVLAPHIGLWDRLRVALFAFWQASEPHYRYQITRRGLKRAAKRGVSSRQVLDFLHRASGGELPPNVRKALESYRP